MREGQSSSEPREPASRAAKLGLAGVALAHLALLLHFAPPSVVLSKDPIVTVDYTLHYQQVDRALAAFRGGGRLWGYDPLVLAGQPAGVVEDLTSKGTELFVIGLAGLGVAPGLAFNLFILLCHMGLPLCAWATSRVLKLSTAEAVITYALWVLLWFFDSFMHWAWWIGMITWCFASYASVLFVVLLSSVLDDPRPRRFVPLALLASALALMHPFVVLTLAIPCVLLYARAFRSLSRTGHALLWLSALVAGSTALIWAPTSLRFSHYIGDVDTFFNAKLEYLLFDSFDLLRDGRQTGGPVRTMVRILCFVAGGITLLRWWRAGDRRALGLGSLVLSAAALAYLSAYSWTGRQTQPYRHIGPAMLAAAPAAAVLLRETLSPIKVRSYARGAQLALVLALVLIVPRFVRTVLHYLPELLPEQIERSKLDVLSTPLVGLNEPKPIPMRHHAAPEHHVAVADWFREHHRGRGRVLVSEWVLGDYLPFATDIPILGGIRERNVPHVDALLFRRYPDGAIAAPELARYLERYAVGFVVLSGEHGPLDARRELLEPKAVVKGYRIYRVRPEPHYFALGEGRVSEQRVDRISVDAARGPAVVLRFHWMETLRCEPGCKVERETVEGDRVGFIRVNNPPLHFSIVNGG